MRRKLIKILVIAFTVAFFAAIPPAIWYCKNYNAALIHAKEPPPVILNIVTVDCGKCLVTIRRCSAEYSNRHRNVRIFITPLSQVQLQGFHDYDILFSVSKDILHMFITTQDSLKRTTAQELFALVNTKLALQP